MAEKEVTDESPVQRRDLVTTGLMMVAALAAVAGFGVVFSMWWQSGITDQYEILRIASKEFIAGRPIIAGELAQQVELEALPDELDASQQDPGAEADAPTLSPEQLEAANATREELLRWTRLRDFLIGVGKVAKAKQQDDRRERRRFLYDSLPELEAARDQGFPPGRETQGHLILGESLFEAGRFDDAVDSLQVAVSQDPTLERIILPMLAEAQLRSDAPLQASALETIERFLSDETLLMQQRWRGELIRIEALSALKRWREVDEAIRNGVQLTTNEISLQNDELDFRQQLRLAKAAAAVQKAIDAHGAFKKEYYEDRSDLMDSLAPHVRDLIDLQREASPRVTARAGLWAARAYLVQGLTEEALNGLTAVRQQRPFGAESVAAGIEELELLGRQGRGLEMLQTTRYIMRELGDPQGLDPALVSMTEFQRRLSGALAELRRNGKFKDAIDTARSLPPVIPLSEALTQEGIGYRDWAASTLQDGTDPSGEISRSASGLSRSRYRAAGDAFAEAAKLVFDTEEYLPMQWSAIDSYQEGRHFSRSIRLLEPYLRYEERRRKPRGLVAFGRALLAEGKTKRALQALNTCIDEYPRDPLRYDARLLAALAHSEEGDLDSARVLLTNNLQDGALTPQSPAWRDSLFTLGEILYERGYRDFLLAEQTREIEEKFEKLRQNQPILEDAKRTLNEAVERYWPVPRAQSAAYLSARANVLASRWPRIEANSPEILDAARRALRHQADLQLQVALDGFTRLKDHLMLREEENRLPENEQKMLRNCFVAQADVLREMDRLEDAAASYRAIELRYMNEPPALEALIGRATCLENLGRRAEANLLVKQALVVLRRIPADWDGRFTESTRFDRAGWQDLLTWMNDRIDNGV